MVDADQINDHDVFVGLYKSLFLSKGREFTEGYLEGRSGRLSNYFSDIYHGAKKAIKIMKGEE